MKAEIVTVGDELLYGQVINTNAAYIGQKLAEIGIEPTWTTTVGDNRPLMAAVFRTAVERADVVIITGGLGPTHDDVTREALADTFDRTLEFDGRVMAGIAARFAGRGAPMPASNRCQAMVPNGAQVIPNALGTAPGLFLEEEGAFIFVVPGVPREMKRMIDQDVIPQLQVHSAGWVIRHRTLCTAGIGESALFERLADIVPKDGPLKVASLPQPTGVQLRLTVRAQDETRAQVQLEALEQRFRERIGAFIYGRDETRLEEVIGRLLQAQGSTLAVVEGYTGGLVADRFSDIPGSEAYFKQGLVVHDHDILTRLLGVSSSTLKTHGAVSEEVAGAMAEGIRQLSRCEYGLATTGITGPESGTPDKPVGLVYVAVAGPEDKQVEQYRFTGDDRRTGKIRATQTALNLLRRILTTDP